jgi:large subunit ribosomal protein L9
MRVILREDIPNLGEAGDVVTVKRGYARNYLIPNKLALEATEGNLKTFKDISRARDARFEKERGDAEILAEKLAGVRLVIQVEVGEEDHLYGSVTSQMIRDALTDEGFEIERRLIQLPTPIKELGTFDIPIRLHREVEPTIQVIVERTTDEEVGAVDWEAAVEAEEAREAREAREAEEAAAAEAAEAAEAAASAEVVETGDTDMVDRAAGETAPAEEDTVVEEEE